MLNVAARNDPTRVLLILSLIILFGFSETAAAQVGSWTKIKGPYQGNVSAVVADGHGYVYAEAEFAGVYTSADGGVNWVQTNTGLNWSFITAFAIDSSGTVYAGGTYSGLFKSADHGASWKRTALPGAAVVATVLTGGKLCVGGFDSVSISTDHGQTWRSSRVSDTTVAVLSMAEDHLGNIYAGLQAVHPRLTAPYGGGVYISSDTGRTWRNLGQSLTSITGIEISRTGDVFISNGYTMLSAPPNDSDWTQDAIGLPHEAISSLSAGKAGEVVAASGGGVYVFNETGDAWQFTGSGLESASITSVWYDSTGKSFAGTDRDGIFFMTDRRTGWMQCGISPAPATAVGFDKSGNLYVGCNDGIYKPSGQDGIWISSSNGLLGGTVFGIDTLTSPDGVFAATSGGLFYSTDRGNYWSVNTGRWTYGVVQTPYGGSMYAATTNGVQVSAGWENWSATTSIGFPISTIYSVLADPSGRIFAGTSNNGVFVTTDGGNFWSQTGISVPFMFCSVKALAEATSLLSTDSGRTYLLGGTIYAGTDTAGAFYTNDYGVDWTHIPSITASNISCFLMKPEVVPASPARLPKPGPMYAGTLDGGLFVSSDGGYNWTPMNTGLADSSVSSLAMDPDGYLYAATGSGVYKTAGPVTGVSTPKFVPVNYSLDQNYPNPFNPTTVIRYRLSAPSNVRLNVYDVLGRRVAALVESVQQAGSYDVQFDGSRLASGVYFYRIVVSPVSAGRGTPAFVQTKKMVLLK